MKEGVVSSTLLVLFFAAALFRGVLVSQDTAVNALENAGYSNVSVISTGWLFVGLRGCSAKDAAVFHAQAVNPAGKIVTASVCSGWPFKGATIRF